MCHWHALSRPQLVCVELPRTPRAMALGPRCSARSFPAGASQLKPTENPDDVDESPELVTPARQAGSAVPMLCILCRHCSASICQCARRVCSSLRRYFCSWAHGFHIAARTQVLPFQLSTPVHSGQASSLPCLLLSSSALILPLPATALSSTVRGRAYGYGGYGSSTGLSLHPQALQTPFLTSELPLDFLLSFRWSCSSCWRCRSVVWACSDDKAASPALTIAPCCQCHRTNRAVFVTAHRWYGVDRRCCTRLGRGSDMSVYKPTRQGPWR